MLANVSYKYNIRGGIRRNNHQSKKLAQSVSLSGRAILLE